MAKPSRSELRSEIVFLTEQCQILHRENARLRARLDEAGSFPAARRFPPFVPWFDRLTDAIAARLPRWLRFLSDTEVSP